MRGMTSTIGSSNRVRRTGTVLAVVALAGSALLFTACSAGQDNAASSSNSVAGSQDESAPKPGGDDALTEDAQRTDGGGTAMDMADAGTLEGYSQSTEQSPEGGAVTVTEREVIATAEMTLRSKDVEATVDAIDSIAGASGGFVSGRDIQSDPDNDARTRATVTVRVPTQKLDDVIDQVSSEAEVERVVSNEQDVTETVIDVDSRVKSARASVDRIRVLLSQANTIGEVVRIESELSRREADLESLLARQRALADQTEMATMTVTVLAPEAVTPTPEPAEDDKGFLAGFERGWEALVAVIVVALTTVGVLLPFLIVAAVFLVPLYLYLRRRPAIAQAPQAAQPPTEEREHEPVG